MSEEISVRAAVAEDADRMATVHVETWRETYRGLMPDPLLDDPEFVQRRRRFWTAALSDSRYADNTAAVAVRSDDLVGIAMSGPAMDEDATWERQLYLLYTYAAVHGSGVGSDLLDAVIHPSAAAALWVADSNPRAQGFYRKHGFRADGNFRVEDGVREIRMVRTAEV